MGKLKPYPIAIYILLCKILEQIPTMSQYLFTHSKSPSNMMHLKFFLGKILHFFNEPLRHTSPTWSSVEHDS